MGIKVRKSHLTNQAGNTLICYNVERTEIRNTQITRKKTICRLNQKSKRSVSINYSLA